MGALGDVRRYVAAAVITVGLLPAAAQEFPNRPITLVVAAAPGGGHDAVARAIAQNLETCV